MRRDFGIITPAELPSLRTAARRCRSHTSVRTGECGRSYREHDGLGGERQPVRRRCSAVMSWPSPIAPATTREASPSRHRPVGRVRHLGERDDLPIDERNQRGAGNPACRSIRHRDCRWSARRGLPADKVTAVRCSRIGVSFGRLSLAEMQRLNGALAVFLGIG